MTSRTIRAVCCAAGVLASAACASDTERPRASQGAVPAQAAGALRPAQETALPDGPWTLDDCVRIAISRHASGRVADSDIDAAEAQLREAGSARWPQITVSAAHVRLDEDPYVINSATPLDLGPRATASLADAAALAGLVRAGLPVTPGDPAFDAAFAQARQQARQQFRALSVPPVVTTLADRDSTTAALRAQFVVYAGGRIDAARDRATSGVDAARARRRESDLEVALRVVQMHEAVLLVDELVRIGEEAHANLRVVLDLTRRVYESGSGSATRADYLRASVITTTVGGLVEVARHDAQAVRTGLLNSMGLEPGTAFALAQHELRASGPVPAEEELLAEAFSSRPDWDQALAGERAADAVVRDAGAGHLPVVALFAESTRLRNSQTGGVVDDQERGWMAGLSVEVPLFDGFAIEARQARARAESRRATHLKELLRQGILAQVRVARTRVDAARAGLDAARRTIAEAAENRSLQFRAYQADLVKTDDVIQSQIFESLAKVGLARATHAYNCAAADLLRAAGGPAPCLATAGSVAGTGKDVP